MIRLMTIILTMLAFAASAQRVTINPVTVQGQSATSIDIRVICYSSDGAALKIYYGYYNTAGQLIVNGDGNISVTNPFSGTTNSAITGLLTGQAGTVTSSRLAASSYNSNQYAFEYLQSGVYKERTVNGSAITQTELNTVKASVLTALGLTQPAPGGTGSLKTTAGLFITTSSGLQIIAD